MAINKKASCIVPVCEKCRKIIDIEVSLETVMKKRFVCGDCVKVPSLPGPDPRPI